MPKKKNCVKSVILNFANKPISLLTVEECSSAIRKLTKEITGTENIAFSENISPQRGEQLMERRAILAEARDIIRSRKYSMTHVVAC